MRYSDKINGFWEEGYHYYLEFCDGKLTVRDYRRSIMLVTDVEYDADLIENGGPALISLADNVLSRTWEGEMMIEIKELKYEDGQLKMLYNYTIMGETLYTLKKVENGPFDYIIIRDDEFIDALQGKWKEWRANGSGDYLTIEGNSMTYFGSEIGRFHVVSYKYSPEQVFIVPENLINDNFGMFCKFEVLPDMLTTYMQVFDMSMPMTVFAREDMMDKIEIPPQAKRPAYNTMMYNPNNIFDNNIKPNIGMMNIMDIKTDEPAVKDTERQPVYVDADGDNCCGTCGSKIGAEYGRFCPECGSRLK